MSSDIEDVIEEGIVEHPDVDVFADWAEITFGVVSRMRGRAMTEPLNETASDDDDAVSVTSAPAMNVQKFDIENFRKDIPYDVEQMQKALQGTGAQSVKYVPKYQFDPDVPNVSAEQVDPEAIPVLQSLAKEISEAAKKLESQCTAKSKSLDPHRARLDGLVAIIDGMDEDDEDATRYGTEIQKIVNAAGSAAVATMTFNRDREKLIKLYEGLPTVVQGDASLVGNAPNDVAEARRAFLLLHAVANTLFNEARSLAAVVQEPAKRKELLKSQAQKIGEEAAAHRKEIEAVITSVWKMGSPVSNHAENETISLPQRMKDIATVYSQMLVFDGKAEELRGRSDEIRSSLKTVAARGSDLPEVQQAIDAVNSMIAATNSLFSMIAAATRGAETNLSVLRQEQRKEQLKQQKSDPQFQQFVEFSEAMIVISNDCHAALEWVDGHSIDDAESVKKIQKARKHLESTHLPKLQKAGEFLAKVSDELRSKYAVIEKSCEDYSYALRSSEKLRAKLIQVGGMPEGVAPQLLVLDTWIQQAIVHANAAAVVQDVAITPVTSSDLLNDDAIINTGTTSIAGPEKAALPLTPAEQQHQYKLRDVSFFEEITQFAATMTDSVDDDFDLILSLQPGSVDELNAATADLRARFKADYLPDLAEMKVALSPFSHEDQLHNQHVQAAFFAYGEYLEACDELKQAISDAYARFGTVVADTDPDIPPPPKYSAEEESAKKFRRDAIALELDVRQLNDFLEKAIQQVNTANSPAAMDQLINDHVATYNRLNAAISPALIDVPNRAQEIKQLNGSKQFEEDRNEGLQALSRVQATGHELNLKRYQQAREDAVARINKAMQLCGPFIRQAKKVIADFTLFAKKAKAPESVQDWPFEIAKKDLHAIRDRFHQTVAIYNGIKNDHGDGAITRAGADVHDALIKAFSTAIFTLEFKLRPAQQTDKAIDEDAKKIATACRELAVRLASQENAAADPQNVSQWNELGERVIKLKSDIRGRKVSEQVDQTLSLFAQVEQVMGFPELETMSNDQIEQKFSNEIAQLTQAVVELAGRFQAITTEAATFKNDADFIWVAPGYADLMERRNAWARLDKNVLGTDLSDPNGRLADVQNRLLLLQAVMSWGPRELTNLVTRTTEAQKGSWDAELALSNARIRADRMMTGFKSLSDQFDLMGEFLQRQPKPRIEIDLNQISNNENGDANEVVHYSAPRQSENDVDSVGSSFSNQSNVIQPVDEEEDFDLNENMSLFSEVTKSSSDNQTDDLNSDDDVLHDIPTFDGTPGSDQHFLEVTNYSDKRLKLLANQSRMRTKAVIKLTIADKETVERLSRREQMALKMEAELEMIHQFLLLNAGSKIEAFVEARKKYDEAKLLIDVLWDEIGKAHERLGTTSTVLMMKKKTTTGDSGESTEYSESVSSKSDPGESTSSSDEFDSSFSGSDDSMSQASSDSSDSATKPANEPPKTSWRDRFDNPDKPYIDSEDYDTPPLPEEKTQLQKMGFAEAQGANVPIGDSQSMPKASAPKGITSALEARYKAIRKKRAGGTGMGKRLNAIDSTLVNEYVRNGGAKGFLEKVTGPKTAKSDDERMLKGFREGWKAIEKIINSRKDWTEKERTFFAQIQAEFATEIEFWKGKPCQAYVARNEKKTRFLHALTAKVMLNNNTLRQLFMEYAKNVEHNEEVVAAGFLWHDKKYEQATRKYGAGNLWNFGSSLSKNLVAHYDGTKPLNGKDLQTSHSRGNDQFHQMLWGGGGSFDRFKDSDILKAWLEKNL